jgi:hypothetical protein
MCIVDLVQIVDNVPPWVAGHPTSSDTFTRIHYQSSIHTQFHINHSSHQPSCLCLYCGPHSERPFACGVLPVVDLMLPSADAPASVASRKRLAARVVSEVGSLDAPIRGDQPISSSWDVLREGRRAKKSQTGLSARLAWELADGALCEDRPISLASTRA